MYASAGFGAARMYSLSNGIWTKMGSDVVGTYAGGRFGCSVSMNSAGDRVAIGAYAYDPTNIGLNYGSTKICSWNGTAWIPLGSLLVGNSGDYFGISVSMNSVGDRVAIGAYLAGGAAGAVSVYSWNGSSWNQMGSDINGIAAMDFFGRSVSINGAGDRVVIGAWGNYATATGYVKVYSWSGSSWVQLGNTVSGNTSDRLGIRVDINSTGNYIIAGAYQTSSTYGYISVYKLVGSTWTQVGSPMYGSVANEMFGGDGAVINDAGDIVAGSTTRGGAL